MARGGKPKVEVLEPLPDKQDLFIMHYAIERDGAKAATLAGYSPRSAYNQASRLLKDPAIREQIVKRCYEVAKRLELNHIMVLQELATIAFAPLVADGLVKASDKNRALELLGQHFKLWEGGGSGDARGINIHITNIDMRTL